MAEKVETVKVTYDDGWVKVTSSTGRSVRINALDYEGGWDGFTEEELALLNKITQGPSGARVGMTHDEMRLFLKTAERAGKEEPVVDKNTMASVAENCKVTLQKESLDQVRRPKTPNEVERQRLARNAHGGYVLFFYDIPTPLNYLNPSGVMWHHGYRVNLSNWILHSSQIEHPEVQEVMRLFDQHDVRYHMIEFAESEGEKIHALAREAYEIETRRIHTSFIKSIGEADEQYKNALLALEADEQSADTEKQRDKKWSYKLSRQKQAIKEAGERLDAAIASAMLYDEYENCKDLFKGVSQVMHSLRKTWEAEWERRCGVPPKLEGKK